MCFNPSEGFATLFSAARILHNKPLYLYAPAHTDKEVVEQNDQGNHQQYVDQAAANMHGQETNQPENNENDDHGPQNTTKHSFAPFAKTTMQAE
jgi:hypothetical protein